MKLKSIYKKSVLLFLFFCIPFFVKANMDMLFSLDTTNIFLEYFSCDVGEFETDYKNNILLNLAQKLIDKSNNPNLKIYIKLDYYPTHEGEYYSLGYGNFVCRKRKNLWEKENCEGLILILSDKDIHIKKILTILSNALDKIDYIKSNQYKIHKNMRGSEVDTLLTIPFEKINQYASNQNNIVNAILNERIDIERPFPKHKNQNINYFFKNNKYHFYYKNADRKENILVVDNIREIEGNTKDGYFIFTTDSTFYYLYNENVKGEFKIDNVHPARSPIYKYQHKSEPLNLFIMRLSGYDTTNQVLFLPDSNLVISNYAYNPFSKKNLDVAIKKQREKNATLKHTTDFKFNFEIAFYISLAIILGLLILIWQRKRK
ncbi:hypothetical protein Fleli_0737 [Bernardetia litoralis DSM 6794]|uniref:Uncharacterized protein n=1 Tax=Bernardetia litoralis (strain ATCC 23117 / DSM 6794 / NBRC 15988 / NCIMB 1366 / Fx l1 / Sio-4) TaxID=880071 RepID=I4AGW2_BERLS|nr:hypothetical protein [Bernardetia litoralis]AFM03197.1 hypothetical protein Fleli_0737 [Bernardetia litoralis DSM 6794]